MIPACPASFTPMTKRCMAVFKLVERFVWLIPITNPVLLEGPATVYILTSHLTQHPSYPWSPSVKNNSLAVGELPNEWKQKMICAIFKKGSRKGV